MLKRLIGRVKMCLSGGMVDTKDLKKNKIDFYKTYNHPQTPKTLK